MREQDQADRDRPPSAVRRPALSGRQRWPMHGHPGLDVVGPPHFALREFGDRLREVGAARQLVGALPADGAEPDPDLVGA